MSVFFQYKVYRQKFALTAMSVVLLTLIACVGTCLFELSEWADEQHNVAAKAFERAEQNLSAANRLVDSYVQRLYADRMLTRDLISLFSSVDMQDYLRRRYETSLGSSALMKSFPSNVQNTLFSGSQRNVFLAVSLYNGEWYSFLTMDRVFGVQIFFHVRDPSAVIRSAMGNTLVASRILYDPDQLSHKMGELQFWINGAWVFESAAPEAVGLTAVMGATGDRFVLQRDRRPEAAGWLRTAIEKPESRGVFSSDPFNRIHYTRFSSGQFPYQLVSVVDDRALIERNAPVILFVCAALTLAGVLTLAVLVSGIRYDARFLGAILQMISRVQNGDFAGAASLPARFPHNEYGMIMRALTGMSRELGDFIRVEYQLKIKQQEATMRALQHQINPHFLYNTLEAIRSHALVEGDAVTADSIAILGGLYRDIVRNRDILTLREELNLLDKYLKIMELRFPGRFCYQMELEPEMDRIETVKFWMQPLAENFFSHGFDRESEYNLFIVSGEWEPGGCLLRLIDNGKSLSQEELRRINSAMRTGGDGPGKNIGLRNVYMRLSHFYDSGFSMEISNNEEAGVCVCVHIPISAEKEAPPHVHTADC